VIVSGQSLRTLGAEEYHTSILADRHDPGGEPMLVEIFNCIFDSERLATFIREFNKTYVWAASEPVSPMR